MIRGAELDLMSTKYFNTFKRAIWDQSFFAKTNVFQFEWKTEKWNMLRVHCYHNVTIFNQHWHSTMDNSCRGLLRFFTNPLYILTSFWVLRTPNPGQNLFFFLFCTKKLKKKKKKRIETEFSKKTCFLGLHTNTSISL